ncbi:MAG: HAMP domain-containing sensor histidine kinase [Pseudomonadota bacterium]
MLQSIYSRFLVLIISPTLILASTTYYAFYERHWDNISENLARHLASEIVVVLQADNYGQQQQALARAFGFAINFRAEPELPLTNHADNLELNLFEQKLIELGVTNFSLIQQHPKSDLELYINYKNYSYDFKILRKRLLSPTIRIFTGWLLWIAAFLILVSWLFLRQQVASVTKLAKAASLFGKGHRVTKFKLTGAKEIRQLGQEFFRMKRRIERQIQQRTELLAGVSHDLRTPLTRMKLILANSTQQEDTNELKYEVHEMEELITSYLAFAKGESIENVRQITINTWLQQLINTLHFKAQIIFESDLPDKTTAQWRVLALKRALVNIIDNAAKVATKITIKVSMNNKDIIAIAIEDNGPGIPEEMMDEIFVPFFTTKEKGTGIGLSLSRQIIQLHGGSLKLYSKPNVETVFTLTF